MTFPMSRLASSSGIFGLLQQRFDTTSRSYGTVAGLRRVKVDKPAEEGAKRAAAEGRSPTVAGPEGEEVDVRLIRECTRGTRESEGVRTTAHTNSLERRQAEVL
jgi:hypothetical protein